MKSPRARLRGSGMHQRSRRRGVTTWLRGAPAGRCADEELRQQRHDNRRLASEHRLRIAFDEGDPSLTIWWLLTYPRVSRDLGARGVLVTAAWDEPLRKLVRAESRDAAYQELAYVIVEAVPGGAAAADDAAQIVDAIMAAPMLRQHSYRACFLWVLVLLAPVERHLFGDCRHRPRFDPRGVTLRMRP